MGGAAFRLDGSLEKDIIVGFALVITGIFGLLSGRSVLNTEGLGIFMLRSGDLSWPPSGDFALSFVGRLIGPKGETAWTFSHDPKVGALGGFEGFQGTDVVFTAELDDFSTEEDFGSNENDALLPPVAPLAVPS